MAVLRYFHQDPRQTSVQESSVIDKQGTVLTQKLTTINQSITNNTQVLEDKLNSVPGKSLSTNDFTDEYKNKLRGIEEGALVNVQSDWGEDDNTADSYIKNKPVIDDIVTQNSENLITSGAVFTAIDELPEPMIFKGSLGTGGTIQTLPAPSADNVGFVYKVITAGTYYGITAKPGDSFISDSSDWILIPSGDEPEGTVMSVGLSVPTGLLVSGSPITTSGTLAITYALGYAIPTTAKLDEWDAKQNAISDLSTIRSNASNGNTAYGWGNHANAGYVKSSGVTSVAMTVPTGLSISGSPITSTGTLALSFANGYSIPTTAKLSNWDTAYGWGNHANAGYLTQHLSLAGYLPLSGGTMTGNISFSNSGTGFRGINYGTMGDNDQWRIGGAATGSNAGYMEIATADDGNEPIYVRLYTGIFGTVKRTLTLLDANGYSIFPSYINIGGHEKNASSPPYVWGSNSSDNYLRSYQTSSLSVNYATSSGNADTVDSRHATGFVYWEGNPGKSNMNDIARSFYSASGMTNLASSSVDNGDMSGWTHFLSTSYADGGNGTNSWVFLLACPAGSSNLLFRSRNGGTVTNGTAWATGWTKILHAGNSSVSKSGETLTVKINGTSQSLTNTNTWRGITNDYNPATPSDSTSLSLTGAKNLYNQIPAVTLYTVVKLIARGSNFDPVQAGYFAGMTTSSGITSDWWHILSMDWSGNDSANWISQLALPTQARNGVYYRSWNAGQNKKWVKLWDLDNLTNLNQLTNGPGYITGITKAMVTTALGYTPPTTDTNTWRGITDSYSGTDSSISLSQKGGKALYDALVNGLAGTVYQTYTNGASNYRVLLGYPDSNNGYKNVYKNDFFYANPNVKKVYINGSLLFANDGNSSGGWNVYDLGVGLRILSTTGHSDRGAPPNYYTTALHVSGQYWFLLAFERGDNSLKFRGGADDGVKKSWTRLQEVSGSDIRLKDIQEEYAPTVEEIAEAPLFKFKWKEGEDKNIHVGTSAQYWQQHMPEVVIEEKDEMKTLCMKYDILGAVNSIAIAKEVVSLKEEIKLLQALIAELKLLLNN